MIKKKSGSSINPDIHHSKVPSSGKFFKFSSQHLPYDHVTNTPQKIWARFVQSFTLMDIITNRLTKNKQRIYKDIDIWFLILLVYFRPGSKGFIVPDNNGKTNVLDKYYNEEFTLKVGTYLPIRLTKSKIFLYFLTSTCTIFNNE